MIAANIFANILEIEPDLSLLHLNSNTSIRRKHVRAIFSPSVLHKLIVVEDYSANHIATQFNDYIGESMFGAGLIIALAHDYGIPTKNRQKANSSPKVWEKRRQTNFLKYGVPHHLCRDAHGYKKRKRTLKRKYGSNITNVFQLESVKQKIRCTLIEKYGVDHPRMLPWFESNHGERSQPHRKIEKFLQEQKIEFISECKDGRFKAFNTILQKEYSPIPDIIVSDAKLVIEINGDNWHANPAIYKANDTIRLWTGETKAKDIWEKDRSRTKHIEAFGYKVLHLWVSDIMKDFDQIKLVINEHIKNNLDTKNRSISEV